MNDDFDDLDRAIFALPLEEAPAGLRAQILRATVYAPAVAAVPFTVWETGTIGVLLALGVWFLIATLTDPGFSTAFTAAAYALGSAFGNFGTLAWIATGGALAVLLTQSDFTPRWRSGR